MASTETANVGRAVAARVGTNIREVRTKLGLTQAQLASPEFSISYISAIERGKIRPSLKALALLAKRLDVPLTFLLEGSPSGAAEARAVGYSRADSDPDQLDSDVIDKFTNYYTELGCCTAINVRVAYSREYIENGGLLRDELIWLSSFREVGRSPSFILVTIIGHFSQQRSKFIHALGAILRLGPTLEQCAQ